MVTLIRKIIAYKNSINGLPVRSKKGNCPFCKAAKDQWCKSGCLSLDPMDYR